MATVGLRLFWCSHERRRRFPLIPRAGLRELCVPARTWMDGALALTLSSLWLPHQRSLLDTKGRLQLAAGTFSRTCSPWLLPLYSAPWAALGHELFHLDHPSARAPSQATGGNWTYTVNILVCARTARNAPYRRSPLVLLIESNLYLLALVVGCLPLAAFSGDCGGFWAASASGSGWCRSIRSGTPTPHTWPHRGRLDGLMVGGSAGCSLSQGLAEWGSNRGPSGGPARENGQRCPDHQSIQPPRCGQVGGVGVQPDSATPARSGSRGRPNHYRDDPENAADGQAPDDERPEDIKLLLRLDRDQG